MKGIVITDFNTDSEIQKKGVEVNDIIVELDYVKITSIQQFENTLSLAKGLEKEEVKLVIQKKDRKKYSIKINPLNELDFKVSEILESSPHVNWNPTNSEPQVNHSSNYATAIGVSRFISFLGWVVFALGIIVLLIGVGKSSQYGSEALLVTLFPSIGLTICGLFLVAAAQVTKATVDNADHTREILVLLRSRNN
ncbi:hypothetical protein RT723_01715 [Psychrosphaera aquimarina]|uniref:PDZ domain-containing protein n=1 Tax=Psychrosphaera aquimarina TaxID=2044854 RepID=A0ABU3QWZ4_9GAMM|nr:hypothetical protein [Psychrosphaera aquimarina]MDU0111747.1 hypothetical protein [Psychrosphaera aquimarina]